jgi:hypothetical protein
MKAGLAPVVSRNQDSLSDMQMRLEVTFPDGYNEPDMSKLGYDGIKLAMTDFPQLALALTWAGWTIPG